MAKKRIRIIDGNNQFLIKYAKATSYQDLVRSCQMLNFGFDHIYWTFDGFDSRAKRRAIYAAYKETKSREKNSQDTTKFELMRKFKTEDLPRLGGITIVEKAQVEADDIIRTLVRLLTPQVNSGQLTIEITSNDADLFDMTGTNGITQPQSKLPNCCSHPYHIPLYKTLVGDSGDNIKGLKLFGEKAWEKLTGDEYLNIQQALLEDWSEFVSIEGFDPKLATKLANNWNEVKMWWKIVSPMYLSLEELQTSMKFYPKAAPVSGYVLTMD